jgi:hypothetical protein
MCSAGHALSSLSARTTVIASGSSWCARSLRTLLCGSRFQDFKHNAIRVQRRGERGEECVKRGDQVAKECGVLAAVHHLDRVTHPRGVLPPGPM